MHPAWSWYRPDGRLFPALRAVLARLESGSLRMPVTDAVRWVDVDLPGEG